jgi:hypothetical protein
MDYSSHFILLRVFDRAQKPGAMLKQRLTASRLLTALFE